MCGAAAGLADLAGLRARPTNRSSAQLLGADFSHNAYFFYTSGDAFGASSLSVHHHHLGPLGSHPGSGRCEPLLAYYDVLAKDGQQRGAPGPSPSLHVVLLLLRWPF